MPTSEKESNSYTDTQKKAIKVSNGTNRLQENVILDGTTSIDFKVLTQDTGGNLSIMVSSNNLKNTGPGLHIHPDFDETFYITEGEVKFKVGEEFYFLKVGDSIFIPRNIPHAFTITSDKPATFLIVCQPAGNIENFFREYSKYDNVTPEIATKLMTDNNMKVVGPTLTID
ncbi:MAG: cupin domain-containing protein [Bacteroidota bacterium]|nr:cupin domain-containing protein [Bacteroidota bacterium]